MPVVIKWYDSCCTTEFMWKIQTNAELIKIEKIEQTTDIKGKVEIL